jgi:very-short-patch-repair endonuclease
MTKKMTSGVVALQYVDDYKKRQSRALRRKPTKAEEIFWQTIRNRKVGGLKFRRQQVIEGFIADFYCEAKRLVLEIDGNVHEMKEKKKLDALRKKVFRTRGLLEIRFTNDQIYHHLKEVISKITAIPFPSPGGEGIQG